MDTIQCSRCGLRQFLFIRSADGYAATCKRCRSPLGFSIMALSIRSLSPSADRADQRITTTIGIALRRLRYRRRKTQDWVARHSRTHYTEISRAETGARSLSPSKLARIISALGVEEIYFLLGDKP
jgi:hypothetical protein